MKYRSRFVFPSFILSLFITVIVIILNLRATQRNDSNNKAIINTYVLMNSSGNLLKTMVNAETGLRGYMITHEKNFLEPYEGSVDKIIAITTSIRRLNPIPEQQYRLDTISNLCNEQFKTLSQQVNDNIYIKNDTAGVLKKMQQEKMDMDGIRAVVRRFNDVERGLLEIQMAEAQKSSLNSSVILFIGRFLVCAILLILFLIIYTENKKKKKSEELLELKNAELERANGVLDRFVYSTSHDLRSPLTSVLGLVGFIEDETKEPDTLNHAHMIKNRIKRLDGFLQNILNYSRNSRLLLDPVATDLKETITSVVAGLKDIEGAQNIEFVTEFDTASQPFYSEPVRLTALLENLVGNAIKYHNTGQLNPFIKINALVDNDYAHITVQDNGKGIDEKHLPKIFNMFYRIDGNVAGSGLGLYLVKEIVEKLNGTIKVESKLNEGTTFTVILENLHTGDKI